MLLLGKTQKKHPGDRGHRATGSRRSVDPSLLRVRGPHAAFDSKLFVSYSDFDPPLFVTLRRLCQETSHPQYQTCPLHPVTRRRALSADAGTQQPRGQISVPALLWLTRSPVAAASDHSRQLRVESWELRRSDSNSRTRRINILFGVLDCSLNIWAMLLYCLSWIPLRDLRIGSPN